LETFFRAHNMRFKALLQERNTAIKSVTALTDDIAIIAPTAYTRWYLLSSWPVNIRIMSYSVAYPALGLL